MNSQQLIEILENLSFVCVDKVEASDPWLMLITSGSDSPMQFLEKNAKRWAMSPRSEQEMQKFRDNSTYDNFHSASHYIVVNKIIHFLKTGEGVSIRNAINHTLACGAVEPIVLEELLKLAGEK